MSNKLVYSEFSHKKGRTFGMSLIVATLSFVMFAGIIIIFSLNSGLSSLEDRMGADLISHLGTSCYKLTDNGTYSYNNPVFKEVENYFDELNGRKIYNYFTQTTNYSSHTNNSYNNSANTTPTKTVPNEDVVSVETLNYISERYDEYIENVKNVIKENCEKNGIDYDVVVGDIFKNEIVF